MSRLVKDKMGQPHKVPDTVLLPNRGMLEIVRSFTMGQTDKDGNYIGQTIVYECPDGTFRQQSGEIVTDKKMFKGMPKEHYDRAIEWLKSQGVADTTEIN